MIMYFRFAASFVVYFTEFEIKKIICVKKISICNKKSDRDRNQSKKDKKMGIRHGHEMEVF